MTNTTSTARWISPAKINRFLHITGQREDGYHCLDSLFQTVTFADELEICSQPGAATVELVIVDESPRSFVAPAPADNLIVRAAALLQPLATQPSAVHITLYKRIPAGGGLGGGSSNAATTLLALNQGWQCGQSLSVLQELGVQLGADVPFFLQPYGAWVTGIGEQMTPLPSLSPELLLLIFPDVSIPTAAIFADPSLRRDCVPLPFTAETAMAQATAATNVMESVALQQFPRLAESHAVIERVIAVQSDAGVLRMTGSGSTFFYLPNVTTKPGEQRAHLRAVQAALSSQGINSVITHTTPQSLCFQSQPETGLSAALLTH